MVPIEVGNGVFLLGGRKNNGSNSGYYSNFGGKCLKKVIQKFCNKFGFPLSGVLDSLVADTKGSFKNRRIYINYNTLQLVSQSISQPATQSLCQLLNQPVNKSTNQPINHSIPQYLIILHPITMMITLHDIT